jgi:hypothetical protein
VLRETIPMRTGEPPRAVTSERVFDFSFARKASESLR